ncbi:MAG: phosphate regulon transcriptional regulatory protein PhoB [Gammaproteobacteria bacterium]|nr:phosphate regulon transcriptional regulatory protein PhoB [Gammaproteobacteria bacterium]
MICLALDEQNYQCVQANSAHIAEDIIRKAPPDLILLDWMMPGISGVDFARRLRRDKDSQNIPIIMLTAKSEEEDLVRGLNSGVDDYLTKPFSTRELIARIHALLRRSSPRNSDCVLSQSGLSLDNISHRVKGGSQNIELGPIEYKLLRLFMENPERVYSREQMLNNVWGDNIYVEERTVDVHIRRLRKALEPTGHNKLIQTVRGSGYRFSSQQGSS